MMAALMMQIRLPQVPADVVLLMLTLTMMVSWTVLMVAVQIPIRLNLVSVDVV
jgi:type III secretory pathway component EscV